MTQKDTRTHADRSEAKQRLAERQRRSYALVKLLAMMMNMDVDEYLDYMESGKPEAAKDG